MPRRTKYILISVLLFPALMLVGMYVVRRYSHSEGYALDTGSAEPPAAATIPLLKGRVEDMTMSPDGRLGWLAMGLSRTVVAWDTITGRTLRTFATLYNPQVIHYHSADQRVYVVDEANKDPRGAVVRVFDPTTGDEVRSIPIGDWRLYRVRSAAFSPDGKWLWLTSSPTASSLYGYVPAALFRMDLPNGRWEQLAGLAPDAKSGMSPEADYRGQLVAADPTGRLFVTSLEPNSVSVFPADSKLPSHHLTVGFRPLCISLGGAGSLLVAGAGELAVIDTQELRLTQRATFEGTPSAACCDATGKRAYVAIDKTNNILVMNMPTAKVEHTIDLWKAGGTDVHGITRLRWADGPPRLIGVAGHRYVPFVLNIEKGTYRTNFFREPLGVRTDTLTARAVVFFRSGHIILLHLKTGDFAGAIPVGGRPVDVAFAERDTVIVALSPTYYEKPCLLRVHTPHAKVTGRIPLNTSPWELASDPDRKAVAVRLNSVYPPVAILRLADDSVQYFAYRQELPQEWLRLKPLVANWWYPKENKPTETGAVMRSTGKAVELHWSGGR